VSGDEWSVRDLKNIAVRSSGGFVEEIGQILAQLVFRNELWSDESCGTRLPPEPSA
jgi:hypothetical protein